MPSAPMTPVESFTYYKTHPWEFLRDLVFTQDQVDRACPIKRFPQRPYLYLLTELWNSTNLLAVPKSRRMTISWTMIGLYTWDTIFHQGRFQAFVSKKEDDANELVKRAKFIIDHLDRDKLHPDFIPKYKDRFCTLEFPDLNSQIQGFPQGADQLRQFTFSGILGDECAFWENAQEFYSASLPTIDGGGRMTLVSSVFPGFFKKICYDTLDKLGDANIMEIKLDAKQRGTGVRTWTNRKNKFNVFELHYTADPEKRSPEYKESLRASMPIQDYLREYELTWDTFHGHPVYPEFNQMHVTLTPYEPQAGLPLLVAFDFGLTPACVIGQYAEDQLVIFKEFQEINMGIERFCEKIIPEIKLMWPAWGDFKKHWRCFIDPAGNQKAQTDETTCAQVLAKNGFSPIPGPINFQDRRMGVVTLLKRLTPKGPAMLIYEPGCPMLTKGMRGGYKYPEKMVEIEPAKIKPVKDIYCVNADAEILTSGGWKHKDMLTVGETVLEYDMANKCLKQGTLLAVHNFNNVAATQFSNADHRFVLTDKHRNVVINKQGNVHVLLTCDLKQGHSFFYPQALTEAPKKHRLSNDLVSLAAWVCAEGYYRKDGFHIRLVQSAKANPRYVAYLDKLSSRLKGVKRVAMNRKNVDMVEWIVSEDSAYMLRHLMPDKCPSTEFIAMMSNKQRRLFLYEFLRADGHWGKPGDTYIPDPITFGRNRDFFVKQGTPRITQKRLDVTNALHHMAVLAGLQCNLNYGKNIKHLTFPTKHKLCNYESLKQETIVCDVWCPKTTNGTWIMRSKGKVYVTGNSHSADALQYLCSGIQGITTYNMKHIPAPTYRASNKQVTGEPKWLRKLLA